MTLLLLPRGVYLKFLKQELNFITTLTLENQVLFLIFSRNHQLARMKLGATKIHAKYFKSFP